MIKERKNWVVGNYHTHPTDPQIYREHCLVNMTEAEVRQHMKTFKFMFSENYAMELTKNENYTVIESRQTWSIAKGLGCKISKKIRHKS